PVPRRVASLPSLAVCKTSSGDSRARRSLALPGLADLAPRTRTPATKHGKGLRPCRGSVLSALQAGLTPDSCPCPRTPGPSKSLRLFDLPACFRLRPGRVAHGLLTADERFSSTDSPLRQSPILNHRRPTRHATTRLTCP